MRPLPFLRCGRPSVATVVTLLALAIGLGLGLGCTEREPRALVVLAHPDDELAIVDYLLQRGPSVRLLFLTRGETEATPQGRGDEAEKARAAYGSASVELIEAPIGRLTLDPTTAWRAWDVAALVERVARKIDRIRPSEVVTWMPNVAAVHGEHQLTGAIVTAACLAARHPPRKILYAFQVNKVGYYRMGPEVFDPDELEMHVERFQVPLPMDRLAALYPSAGIERWLVAAADAYGDGSALASFSTPESGPALGPPRPDTLLTGSAFRVLPHFGGWLERIGLEAVARVIALVAPPGGVGSKGGEKDASFPLATEFDAHQVRREFHDGVLYVLLPQDVVELSLPDEVGAR